MRSVTAVALLEHGLQHLRPPEQLLARLELGRGANTESSAIRMLATCETAREAAYEAAMREWSEKRRPSVAVGRAGESSTAVLMEFGRGR